MVKFGIGQSVTRLEDTRLLTGGGNYTDDVDLPNAARAYILRSPVAHAAVTALDIAEARSAPGVLAVLTGDDVAADDLGPIPCLAPAENRDGSAAGQTPRPILAQGRVRHVGEPVALVVAETLAQARDAAELIEVDYDELPAVSDTFGATQSGAPRIYDQFADNICFDWESGDKAATDAAFANAAHVTRLDLVNNRLIVNSMEPRPVAADYDAASDRSTLYSSTQGVHVIHGQIAEMVLKIGKDKLRCVTNDVGGGFGMKIFLYPEQCLVTWASRKLRRAVKYLPDRSDAFMADTQARDNVSHAELAMDADGRFLGMRVTTYASMGAYLSNFGPFIPTGAGTSMLAGLYRNPAIYVNVKGVITNTVPTDAYGGAGRPEAAYLVERLVDAAARERGLTPDEIRRRNFIRPEDLPYTTAFGDVYDSGDFTALMEECMARADWAGFEARRDAAAKQGRLRGIGLATYVEKCSGGPEETAVAQFNDDDTVTVLMGNQSNGQGHETAYKQVMSHRLGIDVERIEFVQGDSDRVPNGMTGGSRALPVGGAAILGVSDKIEEKGKQVAAIVMETAAVDIEFADGQFKIAGTDRAMSIWEVAKAARDPATRPDDMEAGLDDSFTRVPEASTFPNGCHICELEVDPDTGVTRIERYTVVDDFGDAVNPLLLTGQVHGGITQGVGQAILEHTVYDADSGQLLTGSYMDYTMPRADNVPNFDFSMHNVPCTTNPLGIKGAGEAGAIGAPPAVINALVNALHPATGAAHIDMPATPLTVWSLLRQAKAA